jgi:hypothetical protein
VADGPLRVGHRSGRHLRIHATSPSRLGVNERHESQEGFRARPDVRPRIYT